MAPVASRRVRRDREIPVSVTGPISHALKAEGADASEDGTGRGTPIVTAYGFQPRIARNGRGDMGDVVSALNAKSGETGKGDAAPCVALTSAVRRLTPRECERLQGFQFLVDPTYPQAWQDEAGRWWSPDYTLIPWRNRPASDCPDGPRYKALGNSWAVPLFTWLGERIQRFMPLQ